VSSSAADIGNASMGSSISSRWGGGMPSFNFDSWSSDGGWTNNQDTGTEPSVDGAAGNFSDNNAGSITTEESTQIAFQNIDNIDYSG
jgi:hypothetical protein